MNPVKYYVDADGSTYLMGTDGEPPEGSIEVPFPPQDARQKWNGSEWLPPIIGAPPLALKQIAAFRLEIDGFNIPVIDRLQGIGFAMMAEEGKAWIFFDEPQADTSYIVTPGDGVTKFNEYFEVECSGLTDLARIVQRVQ